MINVDYIMFTFNWSGNNIELIWDNLIWYVWLVARMTLFHDQIIIT